MREITEDHYGIPREDILGSAVAIRFQTSDDGLEYIIGSKLQDPVDDGDGKPEYIKLNVGRLPILAWANADGDIEMLLSSQNDKCPTLSLFVVHDDEVREHEVVRGAERVDEMVLARGWTRIRMKNDFKDVFDFEG